MKPSLTTFATLAALALLPASGAIVLEDSFNDGGRTNGADPLDAEYYKNSTAQTLTVTGGELQISTTTAFHAVVGNLPTPVTLAIGEYVEFSFNFRYLSTPADAASAFRFGLYNSNGSSVTEDTTTPDAANAGNQSQGYYLTVSGGTGTYSNAFYREAGGTSGILAGTDRSTAVGANSTNFGLDDTDTHTATLRITATGSGVNLSGSIDGFTFAGGPANVPTPNYLTFDQLAISNNLVGNTLSIDSVIVNYVPEPSSALLGGLGALALIRRRR